MLPLRSTLSFIVLAHVFLFLTGCKSKKSENAAVHDKTPEDTVAAIMDSYDANRDGSLDAAELEKCPSLQMLLTSMGKGPRGKVTRDELIQRITDVQSSAIQLPAVPCIVTVNGAPLADATVTFTLESFHGSSSAPATGKSDADGRAEVTGKEGVLAGFYRVSVSKQAGGTETIPAKYNSSTILGVEVSSQGFGRGGTLELHLTNP